MRVKEFLGIFFRGMGMGAADIIPGVSGGTIAFITGIYSRLLHAISQVDLEALSLIKKGHFRLFWQHIDGKFLLPLILGIGISIFSLGKLMAYLLTTYPIQVWSFFLGLIFLSALIILKNQGEKSVGVAIAFIAGAILAYGLTTLTPASTPESLWFIFLCGALAIMAMVLPGISGSFILLLLGKYTFILQQVLIEFNGMILLVFGLGCITGLLLFTRIIHWFLANYHHVTVALLSGFMIGSLNKVWPWKLTVKFYTDRHGELLPLVQKNVGPFTYATETANSPFLAEAILFFALGMALVFAIERFGNQEN